MLLLMGFFSIYCGLIYNDTFGLMADFFGTAYEPIVKVDPRGEPRARAPCTSIHVRLSRAWRVPCVYRARAARAPRPTPSTPSASTRRGTRPANLLLTTDS